MIYELFNLLVGHAYVNVPLLYMPLLLPSLTGNLNLSVLADLAISFTILLQFSFFAYAASYNEIYR